MKEATLVVGRSSSRCSACGRNAFPDEIEHNTVRFGSEAYEGGFGRVIPARQGEPGCGATFTTITTPYTGEQMANATKSLRPDLPFLGNEFDEATISGG